MSVSCRYAMRLKNFTSHSATVAEKKLAVLWYESLFIYLFIYVCVQQYPHVYALIVHFIFN